MRVAGRSRGPMTRRMPGVPGQHVIILSALLLAAAVALVVPAGPAGTARADETTASVDTLRTGWDPNEPSLKPADDGGPVGAPSFGQLFSAAVNGQVYAQPVVAGPDLIVATENDWVYSLNAVTGAVNWSLSLGTPWPSGSLSCTDLAPNVGITGTPVYDPATHTVYLAALLDDGPSVYQPHSYIYAIDVPTGTVDWRAPVSGTPVNDPARPFNAFTQMERPALLLMNGWVYAAYGSHCDYTPYTGYVAGVNTSTHAVTLWTDEAGVTDDMAGIWHAGGGLVSDGPGSLIFTSGNGVSPGPGPGSAPPGQLAESTVRLGVQGDGSLAATDFFSPADAPTLDAHDRDFGSGGPVALPSAFGTGTYPHLLAQAGKDGRLFLLNRDSLGGRETGAGGSDNVLSVAGPFGGLWGHPAAFGGSGGAAYVYYVGRTDVLRALKFDGSSAAHPVLTDVANSTSTFGYSSGSPVVTSDGTDPASAVVWEVNSVETGAAAQLMAFDAVPQTVSGVLQMKQIWSAPIGTASKFTIPATDSGRVYVGTRDGHVLGFGSPSSAPLTASPTSFGQVAVGGPPGSAPVTVTATTAVTVTGVSTSTAALPNPFGAGTPVTLTTGGTTTAVTLPQTLAAGDTLTVPVTFTPASPGGATGSVVFATDSANFPAVNVSLSGNGTRTGFYASPAALQFGTEPTGTSAQLTVNITNGGTTPETVQGTVPPSAPFTVTGLPSGTIAPGASVTATVSYKPAAAQPDSSSFTINATDSSSLTVNVSGTGVAGQGTLSAVATTVDLGAVPVGLQAAGTIDLTNTGNLPLTLTAVAPPTVPFGAPDRIAPGLPLGPGYDLQVPVTFTPTNRGPASGTYRFTATDGSHPAQTVTVALAGTGAAPTSGVAVPPPGGGWTLNGSARMSGMATMLTTAATNEAGSAVYSTAVPGSGLHVHFTARLGGGTGADGMALDLLDASSTTPSALGGGGGGLGFAGLHGIAVALVTYKHAGYPSSNFVGVATRGSAGILTFAATSTAIGNLRTGTHAVDVTVSGGKVIVAVDGHQVLAPAVAVPLSVRVAFSGGTGGLTDAHTVSAATITASSGPLPPPGGGWSFNGVAGLSGSDARLTPAALSVRGSVVYPTPVRTNGLQVRFNAQLNGGTGADGLTFGLLDPAHATATALGIGGGGLGFAGLTGVAVALDTYKHTGNPTNNFVGISVTSSAGILKYVAYARAIPQLRTGTHAVAVFVSGGVLTVWLDGEQVLARSVTLTPTSLLAFTGATGSVTDVHTVRTVAIAAASYALSPPGGAGWTYNGSAKMSGDSLVLTPAAPDTHGSAFNAVPVPSAGLHVHFTARLGGGSGADGLTLALLDAARAGPASIGIDGTGLGFSGLPGIAVALVTSKHPGYPSGNFVGVATSGSAGSLRFVATSAAVGDLRTGTHAIDVTIGTAGRVTVTMDGIRVISVTVAVPKHVLIGFSAGTDGRDDLHAVSGVTVVP